MEKIELYRDAVKATLQYLLKGGYGGKQSNLRNVRIYDEAENRFAVVTQGWDGVEEEYINEFVAQIDIVEDKVLIQINLSDIDLQKGLIANGMSADDIEVPYLQDV
jgi:hypothetical protein